MQEISRTVRFNFFSFNVVLSFPNILKSLFRSGFSVMHRECKYSSSNGEEKYAFDARLGFWGVLLLFVMNMIIPNFITLKVSYYIWTFIVLDVLQVILNKIHQCMLDKRYSFR